METYTLYSLEDLPEIAKAIITKFLDKKIIAFYGKMGAGKTTLIKAICDELGVINVVTSPTFALVNEYHTQNSKVIYHFDFYRINKIEEVFDFGYEDYFYSGNLCFIEWPELAENILPSDTLKIRIEEVQDNAREISFL